MIETGIIDVIERRYALDPDGVCFYIAGAPGLTASAAAEDGVAGPAAGPAAAPAAIPAAPHYESVTFAQLRVRAARLARAVDRMDVHRGMWCVADMGNCSAFVYLLVAAAIGGFGVVTLNTRLTPSEKAERLREVHAALCLESLPVFDERAVKEAIKDDMAFDRVEKMDTPRWMRRGMGSFSLGADAVAMFTSGTTGRPKVAPLTWGNVLGAAQASNAALSEPGQGLWQLALPMYHVGGMQVMMRSLLNGNPFILYRKFDAAQVLRDAAAYGATHVSVVDKMLHDMLNVDDAQAHRADPAHALSLDQGEDGAFDPDEGSPDPVGLRGADPDAAGEDPDDPFDALDPFDEAAAPKDAAQGAAAAHAADGTLAGAVDGALQPELAFANAAQAHGGLQSESARGNEAEGTLRPEPTPANAAQPHAAQAHAAQAHAAQPHAAQGAAAAAGMAVPDPIDALDPFDQDGDEVAAPRGARPLSRYRVILLGGAAPNAATLRRAVAAGARVHASYGMTETCSQIASRLVTNEYDGTLTPLPGYQVAVVAPDAQGYGQLAVKGPGVIADYLNARARFTADGFFLTGDTARMAGRCIRVAERTEDMFVSGGENIYPEEVRAKLLQVPGVSDAYVFGDEDAEWGRRPVAVVEAADASREPGFNLQLMTDDIRLSLASRLSRLYQPDHLIVVPEFPRTGIGKTDRRALRQLHEQRIDVRKVEAWRVKLPLAAQAHAAKAKARERETLLVRVTDWAGRTGIGEDVALPSEGDLAQALERDLSVLQDVLAPLANGYVFVHPSQASVLFRTVEQAASHPSACAALEGALWDLYGKVVQRSVARLVGGRECVSERGSLHAAAPGCVPGGAVVDASGARETLVQVRRAVEAGYARVKLKARPGHDLQALRLVRQEFPKLDLVLDAGQSFTEDDADQLRELDALGAVCLVDPLDPGFQPKVGPQGFWDRMARLQRDMRTPLCLDESWTSADELKQVLQAHPTLRCAVVRLGKFGGVQPALEFYWWARERGIALWTGASCDTGISKRLHAAFATLPGMNIPGDIEDDARCFECDIATPPCTLERGMLRVNPSGHEHGIGCELDERVLGRVYVDHVVLEGEG